MSVSEYARDDWRVRAECANHDPEIWQPIGVTGPAVEQIAYAKSICVGLCPVMDTCREWALSVPIEHGILGGLSEDERRALKRRQARARRA